MGQDFQDKTEIVVRSDGVLPLAADVTVAEINAANQTATVPLYGAREIDAFINFSAVDGASTEFFLRFRFSGKLAPAIAVVDDWGYVKIDNIDAATGISTVQDYEIKLTPTARTHVLRICQTSGTWVSCVLWVNAGVTTSCSVSFVRQGGT